MRILPYRTAAQVIDGLVLTFVNIDRLKRTENANLELQRSLDLLQSIVDTVCHPLVVLDESLHVIWVNAAFCHTFYTQRTENEGWLIYDLGNGQWNIPRLRELLEKVLPENSTFNDYRVEHDFPKIGRRSFLLNARRLEREQDLPGMILLALEDVTE